MEDIQMKLASKILIIISICFYGFLMLLVLLGAMASCSLIGNSSIGSILFITYFIYMIFLCAPIIVGSIALKKLSNATRSQELTDIAIVTLILCNLVSGILMLCMKDEDLLK